MIAGASKGFKARNVLQAEALALRDGVKLAVEKKYEKVIFENDSKILHTELANKSFRLVSRKANRAADWLAVQARKGLSFCEWQMPLATTLVGIMNKDGLPAPPLDKEREERDEC
ncbi:hypothetical protein DITRI_Ditri12bG0098400 [Diplodiscus trichospermus]